MKSPAKAQPQQWRQLAATSEQDSDGLLHATLHLMDINSGEDFTVTVTGRAKAGTEFWVGAMTAATGVYRNAAGEPPLANTTLVPPTAHH